MMPLYWCIIPDDITQCNLQTAAKKSRYTCAGIATEYYYKVTVYKHEGGPVAAVGKGYAKVESMASVAMRK